MPNAVPSFHPDFPGNELPEGMPPHPDIENEQFLIHDPDEPIEIEEQQHVHIKTEIEPEEGEHRFVIPIGEPLTSWTKCAACDEVYWSDGHAKGAEPELEGHEGHRGHDDPHLHFGEGHFLARGHD